METYQNSEGSTGSLKDGAFVAFASQAEADKSLKPVKPDAEPDADAKPAPKGK